MFLHNVWFIQFLLIAFGHEHCRIAVDQASVNSSLALNSSVKSYPMKLIAIEEMIASTDSSNIKLKRQRRSAELIKRAFALFAKRLWRGFKRYLEGKAVTDREIGADRMKKIIKLSMINNNTKSEEYLPLAKNIAVEPLPAVSSTTQSLPKKDINLDQDDLNQVEPTSNDKTRDICRTLREKWKYQLVSENNNTTESAVVRYVKDLSKSAAILYQALNKRPHKTFLWPTKLGDNPSSDYTTQFQNLYKLALAYGTKGTDYYLKSSILETVMEGLDFMVRKKGYNGQKYHGDLWDWIIGVPDSFIKIIMIMYDEFTRKQRDLYITIISNYVSFSLLNNFLDIREGVYKIQLAETVFALGILQENEHTIILSTETVAEILKPVNDGDGFYSDGSFIQRKDIPYTGLYGKELIKSIAQILFIANKSKYQIHPLVVESLINIIDNAFLPLIYEGEMIAMVSGRAISRAQKTSYKIGYGSTLIFDLLTISRCVSYTYRKKVQEAVKYWMRRNTMYYQANARNYCDALVMTELLNDDSIIGDEMPFAGLKLYASMDRFVQRTPDYMLGLALHSSRISAFDSGNGENKRGWHTADGMLYLYNDDEVQFNVAYWPTVDPYRLPGTTVDTIHLVDELLRLRTNSLEKCVGGVTNDNQAVIGMSLNKSGTKNSGMLLAMDLQAKKSWFIVDGQIVALGAGITGNTKATIETIVDNRLLNDKFDYLLFSNEGLINNPAAAAATHLLKNRKMKVYVQWILLQESSHKASIGYYFPTKTTVNLIYERRSGKYLEINDKFTSADNFTGNYTKIIINHGEDPVNASYAYVMLPGITKPGLKGYIETNPITILANSGDVQAVKIKNDNYIGINIWKESGAEIAGVSSNKPVSILKQSQGSDDTYVISDLTQSNTTIQIRIPDFTQILRKSEGIEYDAEYNVFVINFANSREREKNIKVRFVTFNKQTHV